MQADRAVVLSLILGQPRSKCLVLFEWKWLPPVELKLIRFAVRIKLIECLGKRIANGIHSAEMSKHQLSRDEFTLIGTQGGATIGARDLAQSRTTNSWEVVTSMARRLPRVYDAAAGPVGVRTLGDAEGAWLGSNSGTATSASSRSTRS
jgi:hypothetical protein